MKKVKDTGIKKLYLSDKLYMFLFNLKEEKLKVYSPCEVKENIVYIFNDDDEFRNYFSKNGAFNLDEAVLNMCRVRTADNGMVIAFKGLCDHIIKRCTDDVYKKPLQFKRCENDYKRQS